MPRLLRDPVGNGELEAMSPASAAHTFVVCLLATDQLSVDDRACR
ncbi:MAG: hypothetical protein AB7J32_00770 [Pseudonocardia sp.]